MIEPDDFNHWPDSEQNLFFERLEQMSNRKFQQTCPVDVPMFIQNALINRLEQLGCLDEECRLTIDLQDGRLYCVVGLYELYLTIKNGTPEWRDRL